MNKELNLGIIGLSPGNGHPYSWSAIFNGYNPNLMEKCGFPTIPRYLEKQNFPDDCIHDAKVTHIYTQDQNLSEHIAKTTNIKYVAKDFYELVGCVDGILLARDDAETHLEFAAPFLEAGLPIYIDKPFALNLSDAHKMIGLQKYPGQIFSCSALRYAQELQINFQQHEKIGEIQSIHAFSPKDWEKYSVHLIEPILDLIPDRGGIIKSTKLSMSDRTSLIVEFSNKVVIHLNMLGAVNSPIYINIIGTHGSCTLTFHDTFNAFRTALQEFCQGIILKKVRSPPERLLNIVEIIEMGCKK